MEELTLKSFEEAAEKVKEATLPTNLVYSEYFSTRLATEYTLSQRICSTQVLIR